MSIAEGTTMNHPDKSASQKSEPQQPEVQSELPKNSDAFFNNKRFMACLVFLPEDSKSLADLLQEFAITSHQVRNFGEPAESKQPPSHLRRIPGSHMWRLLYASAFRKPRSIATPAGRWLSPGKWAGVCNIAGLR